MSEQRDSHEAQPEDLELESEQAEGVKGGDGAQPATGKVTLQDFHFTKKVDKSSPTLG
jgi:type VI protein secretion system component Hcp